MFKAVLLTLMTVIFQAEISAANTPIAPSLVFDITEQTGAELADFKQNPDWLWHVEFGTELLVGVKPIAIDRWRSHPKARAGFGALTPDELLVRDHACAEQLAQSLIGVVGGYELLRAPRSVVAYARINPRAGMPIPSGGVVSTMRNKQAKRQSLAQNPAIQRVVNRISGTRWISTLAGLTAFSRNSVNPELTQAHDWISGQFVAAGLQAQSFSYTMAPNTLCANSTAVTLKNPVGVKLGTLFPNEWVIIGAHYDSRNANSCQTNGTPPQPGANDNGSGCSGVIEMARAFAGIDTARTILFMCFSGEEQGLLGSNKYVQSLQNSGDLAKIKHMINLDMIGHDPNQNFTARMETTPVWQASLYPYYADMAQTYAPELTLIQASGTQAYSDHWYFITASLPSNPGIAFIPGMFTWENGAGIYPQYHTDQDRIENMVNPAGLAQGILRMDAAVLADQAGLIWQFANGYED